VKSLCLFFLGKNHFFHQKSSLQAPYGWEKKSLNFTKNSLNDFKTTKSSEKSLKVAVLKARDLDHKSKMKLGINLVMERDNNLYMHRINATFLVN